MEKLSRPRLLKPEDDLNQFDCGVEVLNEWLKKRALANHQSGASRSYVVEVQGRVIAYYCLSAGSIEHVNAPGKIRRNMPNPIPVLVMGRLAIDQSLQGQGLGAALVADALDRANEISGQAGVKALLVHAKDESAAAFYARLGFVPSPMDKLILMIAI